MCGIAGFVRLAASADGADPDRAPPNLDSMVGALIHRGPDSQGFHRAPGVGLGMRRLAIIDLETGDQPMRDDQGHLVVIQNGEIYNYRQLRQQLTDRGHRFRTQSDTEVLLHGYAEWGDALCRHLRGMFAIAIWDARRQRLFVARDHFGIKPLYYCHIDGHLCFASEIKSLLAVGASRRVDSQALDRYLSFLYVPEPSTIFEHIRALPPGHTLTCHRGEVEIQRYYRHQPSGGRFGNRQQAIEAVREGFADSVEAMMVADVPIGLFLSAGLDSAGILAMMSRHSSQPVRTFSIGFGDAEKHWDELDGAAALATRFASDHHAFQVEPDIVGQLPGIVRHFDQPFANPTALILDLLSRETRKHVKVALSGTGGDELFAGYPRYLGMLLYQRYALLPAPLRRAAATAGRALLRDRSDGRLTAQRLRRFLDSGALPFDQSYARMLVVIEESRKRALYTPAMLQGLKGSSADFIRQTLGDVPAGCAPQEMLLSTDIATYLPFNQLAYGDRMSMKQSLELRVPFVDQRLAEIAAAIPLSWNLRHGTTKALFRDAMRPYLPADTIRGAKRGLNLPIALWFRGPLRGWLEDRLSSQRLQRRGYLRADAVAGILHEHMQGRRDHSLFLWALAVLETWFETYIDADINAGSEAA